MRWIRRIFLFAGIYGLAVIVPQYFMEYRIGIDYPPPINHAEYFYGFIGVALAWQVGFLIISSDPARFRPLILAALVEKFSFPGAIAVLYAQQRVPTIVCVFAAIDLILGILFSVAFVKLGRPANS